MSVADIVVDILKKHVDWMETSALVRDIRKERQVSERQAFRDIKKALDAGRIRKLKLDNDTLYGLPDWDFPDASSKRQEEALTFQDAFKYRCFRRLQEISNLSIHKPSNAFLLLENLIAMLSPSKREKLETKYQAAKRRILELQKYGGVYLEKDKIRSVVRWLMGEISRVLHES